MSFDISLSNIFWGCIYSGKDKVKINKWNYINLKIFQTKAFFVKKTVNKMKRQATKRRYLQMIYLIRD